MTLQTAVKISAGLSVTCKTGFLHPVLDFSHYKVRLYGPSCTLFSVLKQSTRPTVGSNVIVEEIQHCGLDTECKVKVKIINPARLVMPLEG